MQLEASFFYGAFIAKEARSRRLPCKTFITRGIVDWNFGPIPHRHGTSAKVSENAAVDHEFGEMQFPQLRFLFLGNDQSKVLLLLLPFLIQLIPPPSDIFQGAPAFRAIRVPELLSLWRLQFTNQWQDANGVHYHSQGVALRCPLTRSEHFTTDVKVCMTAVCILQDRCQRWTESVNVVKSCLSVQLIAGVACVHEQKSLSAIIIVKLACSVDGGFSSAGCPAQTCNVPAASSMSLPITIKMALIAHDSSGDLAYSS